MLSGYLHFDVRRGLRADMLNAAMLALVDDHSCIKNVFNSLGFSNITHQITRSSEHVEGCFLHFYVGEQKINPGGEVRRELIKSSSFAPIWHKNSSKQIKDENFKSLKALDKLNNDFVTRCLSGQEINLKTLREPLLDSNIKSSVGAVALKILDNLDCPGFKEQNLFGSDALWLFCQLITLSILVDELDPKFISSTKVCIGEKGEVNRFKSELSVFDDDVWLNQIMVGMPFIETKVLVLLDVLGLAFLKTLVGRFGARGESSIIRTKIGYSSTPQSGVADFVSVSLCEASLPETMTECGPSNIARLSSQYEISGIVSAFMDIQQICSMLSLHGASSIVWHLVNGEKNLSFFQVRFYVSDSYKREVIEAFLVKGAAKNVIVRVVEHHELNRRLVSVPLGCGNKADIARFYEYVYFDKTVRVEPLKEDLDQYVLRTDYSVDVARSDLLLAWKKWRGRVAAEST